MIDIMMNGNGDIVTTESGDIALVVDNSDDIIQSANNNILTRLGENIHHPNLGNDVYNKRIKYTDSGLRMIESYCTSAILQDSRIKNVENILAIRGDTNTDCIIQYSVRTIDDNVLYSSVGTNIWE